MDNPTYLSEKDTSHRNYALGYFMKETDVFPEGTDLEDVMDFYL